MYLYPGVYIEELPNAVGTITGVATAVTAFIGGSQRGPVNDVQLIHNFDEFEGRFGGLWPESSVSYSVRQFFQNGGTEALIVRVHKDAIAASLSFAAEGGGTQILFVAANPGAWGNQLRARVDYDTSDPATQFNLRVRDLATGQTETLQNISVDERLPSFVTQVVDERSQLIRVHAVADKRPIVTPAPDDDATEFEDGRGGEQSHAIAGQNGNDGIALTDSEIIGNAAARPKTGLNALDAADIVNLLCVPPYLPNADGDLLDGDISGAVRAAALEYAKSRRAMFLVDSPSGWVTADDPDLDAIGIARDANAAIYFPRIKGADVLEDGRIRNFTPSGAIAGMIARTDAKHGVWKAPAGIEAILARIPGLSLDITDDEGVALNSKGINCLRTFEGVGQVAWGARTLRGADKLADQWKYVPVRRTAMLIEQSIYGGIQWAVFEPNGHRLWSALRGNISGFMNSLFRVGAFQGEKASNAYFVRCGLGDTMTQDDIDVGQVIVIVGFAPLKPAEFVILRIQQKVSQE